MSRNPLPGVTNALLRMRSGGQAAARAYGGPVVFHYCSIYTLPAKLKSGQISVFYGDSILDGFDSYDVPERAAVAWCTMDAFFDPGCAATAMLGSSGLGALLTPGGAPDMARIVVDAKAAPYRWDRHWRRMGIPRRLVREFADNDLIKHGSDWHNWRVSPIPIPSSAWRAVEIWDTWHLQWVPIQCTRDRMVGELIPLLPPHLRVGLDLQDIPRLPAAVSRSCWTLTSAEEDCAVEAEDSDFSYVEDWEIPTFEDVCVSRSAVRAQWLRANTLAALGLAVFPFESYDPCEPCLCARTASSDLAFVDRTWLGTHPDQGIGIVFGRRSGDVFGVWVEGQFRRWRTDHGSELPPTLSVVPFLSGGDATVLLYRAPRGVEVRTGLLRKTHRGRVAILGNGRWQLLDTRDNPSADYLKGGPHTIAQAPACLLDLVRQLPPTHNESDMGVGYQHCPHELPSQTARRAQPLGGME